MSLWCIQIFNVADVNASAEDVTCCPEHKLHLDVKDMQGQGGHRWLVHLRVERSKSQTHPAGWRWVDLLLGGWFT